MDINNKHTLQDQGFSLRQTNIAKGIACIFLLNHHLFYSPVSYEWFDSLVMIGDTPTESIIAVLCRVCVTIFLLLSGYGVNEAINKKISRKNGNDYLQITRTSLRFVWKLWAGYAFVFALFVPWQGLFGRTPYTSMMDFLVDLAGLSDLFNRPTMNATWWYMSVALVSYLLVPFFKPLLNKYKALAFLVAFGFFALFLYYGNVFQSYVFMFGMIASEIDAFSYVKMEKASPLYRWLICILFVLIAAAVRHFTFVWMDLFFAISIIVFSYCCISRIKLLSTVLEFIGKHSANIFFFHTFIYLYNFQKIVYAPKYAPIILSVFIVECLMISIAIEALKKVLFIQRGIDYIGNLIGGKHPT